MFIKLYKINKRHSGYYLSVIHLNPKEILYMSEDQEMSRTFTEGKLELGLHQGASFTKLRLSTKSGVEEITVIDTPDMIETKIAKFGSKKLLRD